MIINVFYAICYNKGIVRRYVMYKWLFRISITCFSCCLAAGSVLASHLSASCPTPSHFGNRVTTPAKLSPTVLHLAKKAYFCAKQDHVKIKKNLITIIDYSLPSSAARLWVINLTNDKILMHLHVAQGKYSGSLYATHFSNVLQSKETSLGLFLTGQEFYGNDGYSLRLIGLEPGFNDKAYQRAIVIHGAWYVSQNFLNKYHRVGLSWGCPAVNPKQAKPLINLIKNGSLVFAYAPDAPWINNSKLLNCTLNPGELSKTFRVKKK